MAMSRVMGRRRSIDMAHNGLLLAHLLYRTERRAAARFIRETNKHDGKQVI